MKSFKRFLTVLEKSRAVFLLLGKGVKMGMQFTEHFQDVLQEYKKVYQEFAEYDESMMPSDEVLLILAMETRMDVIKNFMQRK